ncbi:Rha family transcriptional regulator [Acetobacter persici]|uniref:Rha family transcriptional regulator n=1 Tax=Acetobacter persici TaxID=1076596 RepID=UPI001F2ACCA2|nr:Rha family transcriptional regulator [Acetobacter persici]MCG0997017.1 Rha family transcriptional regulator [Acetobacter persici]
MADLASITETNTLTMSSREIAKLTGKRHDHVIRDIEKMLDDVKIDRPKFGGVYLDAKGEERKCYNLPKNLTLNLIAGYRADLRLKIIDRWLELEQGTLSQSNQVVPPPPTNLTDHSSGHARAAELRQMAGELRRRNLENAISLVLEASRGEGDLVGHFSDLGRRFGPLTVRPAVKKISAGKKAAMKLG